MRPLAYFVAGLATLPALLIGAAASLGPPAHFYDSPLPALAIERPLYAAGPTLTLTAAANTTPTPAEPKATICQAGGTPCPAAITAAANKPLRLTAAGSVGIERQWRIWPAAAQTSILLDAVDRDGTPVLVLFATDAAPLTVQLIATGQAGQLADAAVTVNFTGYTPPIPPNPQPPEPPTPPAPPVSKIPAGNLWFIAVVPDLLTQTADLAKLATSPRLHQTIDRSRNHWVWVDPRTATPDLAPWVQRAQALGLPRALVVDATSSPAIVRASTVLADEAAVAAVLEQWSPTP